MNPSVCEPLSLMASFVLGIAGFFIFFWLRIPVYYVCFISHYGKEILCLFQHAPTGLGDFELLFRIY